MPDNYAEHGLSLLKMGYEPVPLVPGTKKPSVHDWSNIELTEERVSTWAANGRAGHGVGLRTGHLVVIDIDSEDPTIVDHLVRICRKNIGPAPRKTGRAPRAALLYRCAVPARKASSPKYQDMLEGGHQIEILGQGQQTVAFGIHPTTQQPYTWQDKLPPFDELTEVTPEQLTKLLQTFDQLAKDAEWELTEEGAKTVSAPLGVDPDDEDELFLAHHKAPLELTDEQVKEDLDQLSPDMGRDPWLRIGMGLHHQYAGSEHGYDIWNEWSSPSEKYDEEKTRIAWDSFNPDPHDRNPVTFGSVIHQVNEAQAKLMADPDVLKNIKPDPAGFRFFDWDSAGSDKEMPHQIVEDLLVRGQVSLVAAQPNTGKSAFVLDLAAHIARGAPWRGKQVEQCEVLYLAAESPESIRSRIIAMRTREGWDNVPLRVMLEQMSLGSPAYHLAFASKLKGYMDSFPLTRYVVLDTYRSAASVDENSSKEMGDVVRFLHALAKEHHIHLTIVHHLTKSGESYAGSGLMGAIVDTEIRIEVGVKEMEKLVKAYVVQQRSLTGNGTEFWYEIEGAQTGRTTNFGKPETAPLVRHLDDFELEARRVERIKQSEIVKEERVSAEIGMILSVVGTPASDHKARGEVFGKSARWARETIEMAEAQGLVARKGNTFYLTKLGQEKLDGLKK